ncbi:MAG: hypothetical protein WB562_00645 [Candidatus Sulfotelmatobacter sp.]
MFVIVNKIYFSKEHKKIVNPGQKLEYNNARAKELAEGGWCTIVEDENASSFGRSPGRPKKEL